MLGAKKCWGEANGELGKKAGYRNGQMTVIAPTGTIGFMMDCVIRPASSPDLALVKYKAKLVGGRRDQDREQHGAGGAGEAAVIHRSRRRRS